MRVEIKNGELSAFKRMLKHGHAIGERNELRRIIRELGRAGAPIHHGYDSTTSRVVVVMERRLEATPLRRTLKKTVFKLD